MTSKLRAAAIGALLALPACVQAQQTRAPLDPADPGVAVPPIVYEPVAAAPVTPPAGQPTPDKAWRAANDALAGQASHAGHGSHGSHGGKQDEKVQAPAKPAAPVDHGKHNPAHTR